LLQLGRCLQQLLVRLVKVTRTVSVMQRMVCEVNLMDYVGLFGSLMQSLAFQDKQDVFRDENPVCRCVYIISFTVNNAQT
jgi:hypothetical protein